MKLTQTSTTADANELGNYIVSRLHVFGFAELLCRPVWFEIVYPICVLTRDCGGGRQVGVQAACGDSVAGSSWIFVVGPRPQSKTCNLDRSRDCLCSLRSNSNAQVHTTNVATLAQTC